MTIPSQTETLKHAMEALPHVVSVGGIKVDADIIKSLSIETRAIGKAAVCQLDVHDAPRLFEFYSEGLSDKPRRLFVPYPLFHTPPGSANQLAQRITDWKKEDDWSALNLIKDNQIIGFGLLKRFRTTQVTSAIVIRDLYLKKGLGHLLQSAIVEQARLLKLKGFHIKVISDNMASVKLHEKCGFRKTRILPPPLYEEMLQYLIESDKKAGAEPVDRYVIEMVIDFIAQNHTN
jgi:RimJ/RimL family protein N-acetyltransferase